MRELYLRARAKINLTLDVTGKREDGYHNVEMIMQTINLYDELWIQRIPKPIIRITSNLPWLPCDERNLVYQAAQQMKKIYGISQGVNIHLKKRIPVGAGLGGGSSDAAAVLIGLNRLFNIYTTKQELMKIGLSLGADVPYCILRGTALAQGIGEKLTPLVSIPRCWVVLAKPGIHISTRSIYQKLNWKEIQEHPSTQNMIQSIQNQDLEQIAGGLCNVLETVTIKDYPIIADIKQVLKDSGALGSLMSGSGPTVFGLFTNRGKAQKAAKRIKRTQMVRQVFVTTIFQ
mgnify:FL=1